jgi:ribosome-associated protein
MEEDIVIRHDLTIPRSELRFHFARSGGKGGQNVNKVETKVELLFDAAGSPSLTVEQRARLLAVLGTRIDSGGVLHIVAQTSRSQWKNREEAVEKFREEIARALKPVKKRIATKVSSGARGKRLEGKKRHSTKKKMRNKSISFD